MKKFIPLIAMFVVVNGLLLLFREKLAEQNVSGNVVAVGNLIIFLATLVSSLLYMKASANKKTIGFLQQFYGGFLLKFFVLIAAVVIYLFTAAPPNQNGLIVCMALYLVYHFLGTVAVNSRKTSSP